MKNYIIPIVIAVLIVAGGIAASSLADSTTTDNNSSVVKTTENNQNQMHTKDILPSSSYQIKQNDNVDTAKSQDESNSQLSQKSELSSSTNNDVAEPVTKTTENHQNGGNYQKLP